MKKNDFLKLAKKAVKIAEDKKGENVVLLDVREKTPITNYFVIVTANSLPQINAITNEIEKTFKYDYDVEVLRRDGRNSDVNWKVLDFGGIIVHVMNQELRQLYNLEHIWESDESKPKKKKTVKKVANKKTATKKVMSKKTKTVKKSTKKIKK
ncbi:ribosome silencing factor [Candidatus Ruminimicrobium bovinum]|uniref:ribosome silencing factor n=1 Tax=Candidatus Ruminimicrobium bovinum TaxID=3242779 RepID=UPI0039B972BB